MSDSSVLIRDFVAGLDQENLENEFIKDLISELKVKYPDATILGSIMETIDIEIEQERTAIDYPWILFALSDTAYSINSKYVLSIEILGEITPIVDAQHYSPGITESRGEMIELVDMHSLFGSGNYLDGKGDDAVCMMIVTEIEGVKRAIIVDEILAVEHIKELADNAACGFCDGCFSGNYPVPEPEIAPKSKYERRISEAG